MIAMQSNITTIVMILMQSSIMDTVACGKKRRIIALLGDALTLYALTESVKRYCVRINALCFNRKRKALLRRRPSDALTLYALMESVKRYCVVGQATH
jgi:hypothetical protein